MTADVTHPEPRELAHRESGGVEVVLFWHQLTDELTVSVSDVRTGAYFELAAAPEEALDVFHHPYANAAYRGVPYDDALLPSWALTSGGDADISELLDPTRSNEPTPPSAP
jgi:hypothetical protein